MSVVPVFGRDRHSYPARPHKSGKLNREGMCRHADVPRGVGSRRGLLERAAGGTALLKEIGSLSEVSQDLLLRLLGTKEVVRLGGHKRIRIDVRAIATATLADPRAVAGVEIGSLF